MADENVAGNWQPIETAPLCAEEVLVWVSSVEPDGEGWIKVGTIGHFDPVCLIDYDGCEYWPHENGGYPTHWQPMPLPPAPTSSPAYINRASAS
jgi:hypothetical protein